MKISYSIIIPVHNSSEFITRLLESIPRREDAEVIVVDDYSTDDESKETKKMVLESDLPNTQFLINKGVNSAGAARNIGLENASGKWLVFADSDDYFTPDLSKMMDKYVDSDLDQVVFLPMVDENASNARRTGEYKKYFMKNDIENIAFRMPSPWSRFVKSCLVKTCNLRFDETLVSNDMYFTIRSSYFAENRKELGEKSIYVTTTREGSLTSHKMSYENIRTRIDVRKRTIEFLKPRITAKMFRGVAPKRSNEYYRAYKSQGLKGVIFTYKLLRKSDMPLGLSSASREMWGIIARKVKR